MIFPHCSRFFGIVKDFLWPRGAAMATAEGVGFEPTAHEVRGQFGANWLRPLAHPSRHTKRNGAPCPLTAPSFQLALRTVSSMCIIPCGQGNVKAFPGVEGVR